MVVCTYPRKERRIDNLCIGLQASIFGHYPQKMWKAPETRVKSNDPRCRDRYIERVLQKYEEEKIFVQCEALRQLCLDHDKGENVGPAIEELHAELKEKTIRILAQSPQNKN
jgi:hypothetical protein